MLIYDNEYETKEIKIEPRIKLNYNVSFTHPMVSNAPLACQIEFCVYKDIKI